MYSEDNQFSEEQVIQIKEVFGKYDVGDDVENKRIPSSKLEAALKDLEIELPADQLKELIAECENENKEIVWSEFVSLLSRQVKDLFSEDELIESFKVFDPNDTGVISKAEFRHIMRNYGEKLSPEEAEEICKDADMDGNGQINYRKFVAHICQQK